MFNEYVHKMLSHSIEWSIKNERFAQEKEENTQNKISWSDETHGQIVPHISDLLHDHEPGTALNDEGTMENKIGMAHAQAELMVPCREQTINNHK